MSLLAALPPPIAVRATLENSSGSRAPMGQKLNRGDNALLPFAGAFTFASEATTILLITENFA